MLLLFLWPPKIGNFSEARKEKCARRGRIKPKLLLEGLRINVKANIFNEKLEL